MTLVDDPPRLRQPEYTGENRCAPCTVANLLVAGVIGAGLALLVRPAAGALAFGAGAVTIYLRGYLIPGTPTLTRRYFPPWLLRAFGKDPVAARTTAAVGSPGGDTPPEDADSPLVAAGVLDHEENGEPTPTESFAAEWQRRIDATDEVDPGAVTAAFGGDTARRLGGAAFVLDESASLRWGSEGALVADVTAAGLVAARLDAWADWDRDTRRSVLMGLRLCLETCPSCGGPVRVEEDRVDPCCQRPHLVAEAVCEECGSVLADTAVVDDGTAGVRETLLEP